MVWNDILRKLTSRKFWMAVASFVTNIMVFNGATAESTEKVAALILAGATVIAYIVGEGLADAAPTINEENLFVDGQQVK